MSLPESVAIQFDLYTLACHELSMRWEKLVLATLEDLRQDHEKCLSCFDGAFRSCLENSSASNSSQAVEHFARLLSAQVGLFRASSPRSASVFDEVVQALYDRRHECDHLADIERFHIQGRDLARQFFAESEWPSTQARMGIECHLELSYESAKRAPMAYRERYSSAEDELSREHVILVRFSPRHSFTSYLALPFFFLHEYTAHVYAMDYGNNLFNDGWMLWAAQLALWHWPDKPIDAGLNCAQRKVFLQHLCRDLRGEPYRGFWFAMEFQTWLPDQLQQRFRQYTYELAAFQSPAHKERNWQKEFIQAVETGYILDQDRLLSLIQQTSTARELWTALEKT